MDAPTLETYSINIRIKKIDVTDFSVESLSKSDAEKIDINNFAFEYNSNMEINPTDRIVRVLNTIKVFNDLNKTLQLGNISVVGEFEFQNMNEILKLFNGQFPIGVLSLFTNTILSTTRGILLMKSEGTIIEGAMLPLIDSSAMYGEAKVNS